MSSIRHCQFQRLGTNTHKLLNVESSCLEALEGALALWADV